MTSQDPVSQRRHARHAVSVEVRVVATGFDHPVPLVSSDLSLGGVFISTEGPLPVGTSVGLVLVFPGHEREIEVMARVARAVDAEDAWAQGGRPGMGLQFTDPTPELLATVEELIWEAQSESAGAGGDGPTPDPAGDENSLFEPPPDLRFEDEPTDPSIERYMLAEPSPTAALPRVPQPLPPLAPSSTRGPVDEPTLARQRTPLRPLAQAGSMPSAPAPGPVPSLSRLAPSRPVEPSYPPSASPQNAGRVQSPAAQASDPRAPARSASASAAAVAAAAAAAAAAASVPTASGPAARDPFERSVPRRAAPPVVTESGAPPVRQVRNDPTPRSGPAGRSARPPLPGDSGDGFDIRDASPTTYRNYSDEEEEDAPAPPKPKARSPQPTPAPVAPRRPPPPPTPEVDEGDEQEFDERSSAPGFGPVEDDGEVSASMRIARAARAASQRTGGKASPAAVRRPPADPTGSTPRPAGPSPSTRPVPSPTRPVAPGPTGAKAKPAAPPSGEASNMAVMDIGLVIELYDDAIASLKAGEVQAGLRIAQRLNATEPDNPRYQALMRAVEGVAARQKDRPKEARVAFLIALELDPDNEIANRELDAMDKAAREVPKKGGFGSLLDRFRKV